MSPYPADCSSLQVASKKGQEVVVAVFATDDIGADSPLDPVVTIPTKQFVGGVVSERPEPYSNWWMFNITQPPVNLGSNLLLGFRLSLAGLERVGAWPPIAIIRLISPRTPVQQVVAVVAVQRVGVALAVERVVSPATMKFIPAVSAAKLVDSLAPAQLVSAALAVERVIVPATLKEIVAVFAV